MVEVIPILNMISCVALAITAGLIAARYIKKYNKSLLTILLAMILLMLSEFTNVVEHLGISAEADEYEDLLEVVFLPLLILAMHIGKLEEELSKRIISERKFSAIFNNASTFIGLLDTEGRVLDANSAALKFSDIPATSAIGQNFKDAPWWAHSDFEQNKLINALQLAKKGQPSRFETTHPDGSGKLAFIDFSLTPIFNENGEVVYLIPEGRNITELKLIQEELEIHRYKLQELVEEKTHELNETLQLTNQLNDKLFKSNHLLEKRNQELNEKSEYLKATLEQLKNTQNQLIESEKMASLGILTAGVAHEINNPLNFIMGGITGIDRYTSEHFGEDNIEIKQPIEAIYSGINRISSIVKNLNSYSRANIYEVGACSINEVINDCLMMLHGKLEDRIQIHLSFTEDAVILANESRVHQVFLNLLHNAIQSIEDQGNIHISTETSDGKVITTIMDDGKGIAENNLKKIFDPFFTTKEPEEGVGLGLSISQRIISDYKGSIRFESEVNKGTTVYLTFQQLRQDQLS